MNKNSPRHKQCAFIFLRGVREVDIQMFSLNRQSNSNDYEDISKYCSDIYAEIGDYATIAAKKASLIEDDDLNFSNYVPMAPAASVNNIVDEINGRDNNYDES